MNLLDKQVCEEKCGQERVKWGTNTDIVVWWYLVIPQHEKRGSWYLGAAWLQAICPYIWRASAKQSYLPCVNSLGPGRWGRNFKYIVLITFLGITTFRWTAQDAVDGKSTFVEVMARCCQATRYYQCQCLPRSMPPYQYGITGPQWVKHRDPTVQHRATKTKWTPLCRQRFQIYFSEWKYISSD